MIVMNNVLRLMIKMPVARIKMRAGHLRCSCPVLPSIANDRNFSSFGYLSVTAVGSFSWLLASGHKHPYFFVVRSDSPVCCYSTKKVKAKKKGASQKDVNVDDVEGIIDLRELKQSMESIVENVKDAFRKKYSARINPGILDELGVFINGQQTKLVEHAQVSSDAKEFTVSVMSKERNIHATLIKSIQDSGLNLSPRLDGSLIKVPIPLSTTEYRENLAKLSKATSEEAKVAIRRFRQQALIHLRKKKDEISQDDGRSVEKQIQQITDMFVQQIDTILEQKVKELTLDRR